jgi:hypothetical protein
MKYTVKYYHANPHHNYEHQYNSLKMALAQMRVHVIDSKLIRNSDEKCLYYSEISKSGNVHCHRM